MTCFAIRFTPHMGGGHVSHARICASMPRHYYHHVQAFPCYLAQFALRLDEGELRQAVLANMCDEKGVAGRPGKDAVPHSELWLDFAEGMGASRDMRWHLPVPEIAALVRYFQNLASEGTPGRGSRGLLCV